MCLPRGALPLAAALLLAMVGFVPAVEATIRVAESSSAHGDRRGAFPRLAACSGAVDDFESTRFHVGAVDSMAADGALGGDDPRHMVTRVDFARCGTTLLQECTGGALLSAVSGCSNGALLSAVGCEEPAAGHPMAGTRGVRAYGAEEPLGRRLVSKMVRSSDENFISINHGNGASRSSAGPMWRESSFASASERVPVLDTPQLYTDGGALMSAAAQECVLNALAMLHGVWLASPLAALSGVLPTCVIGYARAFGGKLPMVMPASDDASDEESDSSWPLGY